MSPSTDAPRLAPSRTLPKAALKRAAFAVPYLVLLVGAYSVFCVTTDDPFITYRYAANLLAGHGPVFNIGERVEGFSSPLHLLLVALLLKIIPAGDILFKAKLLGLGFAALALWQTGRLARAVGLSEAESVTAQALVAVNNNFALAAVNGMETTLALCLVLGSVLTFGREIEGRGGVRSAGLLFLAMLARPDAALLFAVLLLIRVILMVRRRLPWWDTLGWASVFLLPATGLLLARFAYYGQWVPNTYYAKQVTSQYAWQWGPLYLLHPLSPIRVAWDYLKFPVPLWSTQWQALGTVVFWGLALLGCARRGWWTGAILTVVLAQIAFVLHFGGDWMPGWRFVVPVLPLLAVLQVQGLGRLRGRGLVRTAAAPILVVALWIVCAAVSPHNPWSNARFSAASADLLPADNALGRKWIAADRYIHDVLPPGGVIAYSEMGYAGYHNLDKTFIDVRGLTDREIARLPASYKGPWGVDDEQWMFSSDPLYRILRRRQPTTIIAFSHPSQMPPAVLDHYYLIGSIQDPRDPIAVIDPALVYRPLDQTLNKAPRP
jgi:arabinofuranosyltransferase